MSKMIDPPSVTDQYLTKVLKLKFSLHMVKDLHPPSMTNQYLI